jgi:hypothetical protein
MKHNRIWLNAAIGSGGILVALLVIFVVSFFPRAARAGRPPAWQLYVRDVDPDRLYVELRRGSVFVEHIYFPDPKRSATSPVTDRRFLGFRYRDTYLISATGDNTPAVGSLRETLIPLWPAVLLFLGLWLWSFHRWRSDTQSTSEFGHAVGHSGQTA